MDIEAKIDAIRGGHLHVIAQLSIGETMDICSRLRAYEKELADLRAYKQSAEAKIKEYEQSLKLSGEVNAKLMRELLEMQDKVAAVESQEPVFYSVHRKDSEPSNSVCFDDLETANKYVNTNYNLCVSALYAKPVPADKPAVAVPEKNGHSQEDPPRVTNYKQGWDDCIDAMLAAPSHSQQSSHAAEVVQLNQDRYATVLSVPGVKLQHGDKLYIDRCQAHDNKGA